MDVDCVGVSPPPNNTMQRTALAPPLMLNVRQRSKRPRIALTAAKVDTPLQLSTVVRSRR